MSKARRRLASILLVIGLFAGIAVLRTSGSNPSPQPQWMTVHQATSRHVPVVVIIFDEFPLVSLLNRRGEIDAKLFPHFAQLQRDSVWFRNTSAVTPFSVTAMPAILTGKYPDPPRRPNFYPRNLFTLLAERYEIRTPHPVPKLCPSQLCGAAGNGEPRMIEVPRLHGFGLAPRGSNFISFLKLIRPTHNAHLYYLHLVMPHTPWIFLPSGRGYHGPHPTPGEVEIPGRGRAWGNNRWLVTQAYQRHLLQVRLVDKLLGTILRELRRASLYHRALIVTTADQGIAFNRGLPKRRARPETVGQVALVPLFMKRPFQTRARISDDPVELVDLLPTMADVLNLPNVWRGLDGTSAFEASSSKHRMRRFGSVSMKADGSEIYAAIKRKYETFNEAGKTLNLFNVAPGNTEPLLGKEIDSLRTTGSTTLLAQLEAGPGIGDEPSALVEGTLTGARSGAGLTIALGVNDRVAALTKTFRAGKSVRFYSLLPPRFRSSSTHSLELFVIERDEEGRFALGPISTTQ